MWDFGPPLKPCMRQRKNKELVSGPATEQSNFTEHFFGQLMANLREKHGGVPQTFENIERNRLYYSAFQRRRQVSPCMHEQPDAG
jgi:hypothetical protein